MKKVLMLAGIVASIGLTLAGCAPDKSGNAAFYNTIDSVTDCQVLQRMFDQYKDTGWQKIANGEPDGKYYSSYMKYTTSRMDDLKCYG